MLFKVIIATQIKHMIFKVIIATQIKHMIFKVIIATQIKHMIACPGKNTQTFMEILDKKY